jgi:site-specific recombinase XerC
MPGNALARIAVIEEEFAVYLERERGLGTATVQHSLAEVRLFLATRNRKWRGLQTVRARDIRRFIAQRAQTLKPVSLKGTVSALRRFFHFLFLHGDISVNLAAAVPAVAHWRLSALPRFISADEVNRIIDSCDRRTVIGRRDFAILSLLARLGLRAGEVAAMTLDDIRMSAKPSRPTCDAVDLVANIEASSSQ